MDSIVIEYILLQVKRKTTLVKNDHSMTKFIPRALIFFDFLNFLKSGFTFTFTKNVEVILLSKIHSSKKIIE